MKEMPVWMKTLIDKWADGYEYAQAIKYEPDPESKQALRDERQGLRIAASELRQAWEANS